MKLPKNKNIPKVSNKIRILIIKKNVIKAIAINLNIRLKRVNSNFDKQIEKKATTGI